ncbi:hypothetical protein [Nonomuraea recticatena]
MPENVRPPRRPALPPRPTGRTRLLLLVAVAAASAAVLVYSIYVTVSEIVAGYTALFALALLANCSMPADGGFYGG